MSLWRYFCLSHPARNAHASYYIVIYGLSSSSQTIFPGGWGVLNIKCVFWFSLKPLSEIFLILRRIRRVIITNVRMYSLTYSCQILMKLESWRQIFEKPSNVKFHKNSSFKSQYVPWGQTGMTKLIVAFRNFTKALKNGRPKPHCKSHFPQLSLRVWCMEPILLLTPQNWCLIDSTVIYCGD
jgi:hypothetical protein